MGAPVQTGRSDGRSERRIPQKLTAELSHPDASIVKERAFTENVNPHGARVTTGRPWQLGSRVLITFPEYEVLSQGRIVYCQRVESRRVLYWDRATGTGAALVEVPVNVGRCSVWRPMRNIDPGISHSVKASPISLVIVR